MKVKINHLNTTMKLTVLIMVKFLKQLYIYEYRIVPYPVKNCTVTNATPCSKE
jgi:hypothetical protein